MNDQELKKILHFAENLMKKVGIFIHEKQKDVVILNYKDRQDILTSIDIEAEKILINAIQKEFPAHTVISEEAGLIDKKSPYQWVLDPLDGTKEYIRHIPLYCSSLSLQYHDQTIIAVNNHVGNNNDIFSAGFDLGAYRNGKKTKLSDQDRLDSSYLYYHTPVGEKTPKKLFQKIWNVLPDLAQKFYRIRGLAHENLILDWMADGGAEAYVYFGSPGPKWWDLAAGLCIFKESGGVVTDLTGNPLNTMSIDKGVLATNGKIHDQFLAVLSKLWK